MDLRKTILKEHSKANTNKIVKWIGNDPERFKELVELFLANEYRVTQRAAWALSYCAEEHPELVKPYLGRFIKNLGREGLHDAVLRNTLRFLQFTEVPTKYLGELTNTCFRLLQDYNSPIAVKVFSMTVLLNICKREPGMKNELKLVVEDLLPNASSGLRNRALKTLKVLDNLRFV